MTPKTKSKTKKVVPRLAIHSPVSPYIRELEVPVDDEQLPHPIKGAVPIPAHLRGPAPESAVAAAERDAEAEAFEQEIRKEFPDRRSVEAAALRRFWSLWRAHYLKAGHKRLARFALHYFE